MNASTSDAKTIFGQAIDIEDAAARAAYLDQACGSNDPLRAEIDSLICAHFKAGDFLKGPAHDASTYLNEADSGEEGMVIGPYKLLERIGEGGMGVVFMADQHAPVRRRVALKIIKPGMDSRQVLGRFEAERQALALMDHPNIARALDAGVTDSGRPYFVMELVRGAPITDYCDQNNLAVHERLELFVNVCRAVQHAHQKGIIHRDIKPSNVLVTLQDGRPVPKVIDFGVAKAINQQLTQETLFTRFAEMIGTPLYMSPEQAEMTSLDVDTRSDIYSLGVLLYELLTGTTPFDKNRLKKAAYDEIRRIIREEEPAKPSTRISTLGDTSGAVASHRHADPHGLSRLVRGDLDWIVMKALEKDRTRRYETANGLAADVERHLADEPVLACPPSAAYRFVKFARRNRVAFTMSMVVLAAVLLGAVGSVTQAIRATHAERLAQSRLQTETTARADAERARQSEADERQIAEAQRSEAEKMRKQAEANSRQARGAVDDMYTQVAEKWLAQQPRMEPTQREFLKKALSFYRQFAEEKASRDPEVRLETARAYSRVGEIQHKLGEAAEAEKAYNEAILAMQGLVDEFPHHAEYQRNLAESLHRLGVLVGDTGRHPEEEKVHRRALVLQRKLVETFPTEPKYRRDLARGLFDLGSTNYNEVWSGRDKEMREVLGEAIALQKKLVAEVPSEPGYQAELAESLNALGGVTPSREGQNLLRQSAGLLLKLVADFPRNPAYRDALGDTYFRLARTLSPTDAVKAYHQGIEVKEKLLADFPSVNDHRSDVAQGHRFLGRMLERAGKISEAETAYRQSLAIGEPLVAIPKIDYYRRRQVFSYWALGDLLAASNRFAEAEKEYKQAIAVYENWLAEDPKNPTVLAAVADGQLRLASLLAANHRPDEAAKVFRQEAKSIERLVADFPKNVDYQLLLANCHNDLADLLKSAGRLAEAEQGYRRALALKERLVADSPANPDYRFHLAQSHLYFVDFLRGIRHSQEAEKSAHRALALFEKLAAEFPGRDNYRMDEGHTLWQLGYMASEAGRHEEAEKYQRRARSLFEKLAAEFPTNAYYRLEQGNSNWNLGGLLRDRGRLSAAEAAFRQAVAVYAKLATDFSDDQNYQARLARSYLNVIDVLRQQGKQAEKEQILREAAGVLKKAGDSDQVDAYEELGQIYEKDGLISEAVDAQRRAVAAWEKRAAKTNERGNRWRLGGAYEHLGDLLIQGKRTAEAEAASVKAVSVWEKLAAETHERDHWWHVACNYERLGDLLSQEKRKGEAEAAFVKAVPVWEKVAAETHERDHRWHVASIYGRLGDLLSQEKRTGEAEKSYHHALALFEKLAVDFPAMDNYRMEVGHALWHLGYLASEAGRHEEAEKYQRRALSIFEQLAAEVPTNAYYRFEQGNSNWNLGGLLRDTGRRSAAEGPLRQAVAVYAKLTTDFPHDLNYRARLVYSYLNVIEILRLQGKQAEKEKVLREAVAVLKKAGDSDQVGAYEELGQIAENDGRMSEAVDAQRGAVAAWEKRAAKTNEHGDRWRLGGAYEHLGDLLSREKRTGEAEAALTKAVSVWEKLAVETDERDHRWHLAGAYEHLARLLGPAGRGEEAKALYVKAAGVWERMVREDPNSASAYWNLGEALVRLGRWDQAVGAIDKAVELEPANHLFVYHAATLHLRAGDIAGYRRACQTMLERFQDTDLPEVAERTAKTCLLLPNAVPDLDRVQKLADRSVAGTEKHGDYRWFVFVKGLGEYRAGRDAEAVTWLKRFGPNADGVHVDASAFALLAMAQHRLGQEEQARAALHSARVIFAKKMPDPAAGRPFEDFWQDWLHCEVLVREAEALLKPQQQTADKAAK